MTQVKLAKELGVKQETVSRMERQSDMLLSTLEKSLKKLGGELVVMAKFPGVAPVRVRLGDDQV